MAQPLPPTNDLRRVTCRTLKPPVRPWQPDTVLELNRGNFHFIFLLSRAPANGRWMRLSLVVETGDSVRDGAGERVGIGEGAVGELMLLEVAPASFDIVQFWGVFGQPFEGEPGALGERLCGQLAAVDRPVIENRDQGPGAFGGAVYGAVLIELGNEVGGALGGAGIDEQVQRGRMQRGVEREGQRSRWSAWWRWYGRAGAGEPDQRARPSPAFSPGRALGCADPIRAWPNSGPDRDA